jgi:acyl-CoA synthetase (AMP-forming)/AMP-acid ligase II
VQGAATLAPNRYQEALLGHFAQRGEAVFCWQVGEGGEEAITWRALEADCRRFGAAYREAGVEAGDQVLIFLRHVPELYGAFFGAMLTGVTPAFMPCSSPRQDPDLYWRSHQELLRRIAPAAIVTDAATLAEMTAAGLELDATRTILIEEVRPAAALEPRAMAEDAIALLQHSSGTTGLKKGVALSWAAIVRQAESYAAAIALSNDDSIVSWLPLYHDMGLIACLILPAYFATPMTHLDPFHWIGRPQTLFEHLEKRAGALTWLPNFAFEHLAATAGRRAAKWDLSGVRAFINCSEPCKPATFDRFAAAFAPSGVRPDQLQCCYAMAETVFAATQTPMGALPHRLDVDPASLDRGCNTRIVAPGTGVTLIETGSAIEGLRLSIHDEGRAPLEEGCVGEIAIAGDFLFSGYNGDPVRTHERLQGGLYFSRDLGFLREGRLYVLGRMDDLIIINGRNLYAHEIEAQVNAVAGIKPGRAVAIAWFDPRVGSETLVIMAERARAAPHTDEELRRAVMIAVHSVFNVAPRAVELLEEGRLIKTTSGKISRKENLARYIETIATAATAKSR